MNLISRAWYAFMAATVFSAVIFAIAGLSAVVLLPHLAIGAKAAQWGLIVPSVLFPICFIYASELRARLPLERTKKR
jgi:hypothetical protein